MRIRTIVENILREYDEGDKHWTTSAEWREYRNAKKANSAYSPYNKHKSIISNEHDEHVKHNEHTQDDIDDIFALTDADVDNVDVKTVQSIRDDDIVVVKTVFTNVKDGKTVQTRYLADNAIGVTWYKDKAKRYRMHDAQQYVNAHPRYIDDTERFEVHCEIESLR